jgi:hypothetical protein
MKKLFLLKSILITSAFVFCFNITLNANWQKSDTTPDTQYTPDTQHSNSDSLPNGVTKDWLNDLRDENGNRISNGDNIKAPGQIPEDPEEDALQRKVLNGLSAGSQFGVSVSSAGDVNGDGFDDIIIGAYLYNSNTGRAYIYYGGLNLNTTADVVLTGEAASNVFGCSVSSAGDVNGDGYSDVIAGAYGYSSNKGRAYIFYGGASMNNTADVIMTGESNGNDFGTSVSTAGDVNGDGYSDVIAGADLYSSNTGRAYIFFGGASMNNLADVTMIGAAANNTFGKSVSSAGDVNSDGFSDIIIGANGYSSNTGRAYIFFGAASMDNTADVILTGETTGNNFGVSVSSAGDVNGDGYSDVICGAYGYNSNTGKAYIYYGGGNMNSAADLTMSGESTFNFFGNSVSTAGDVNGDGFSDVIISAFGYNSFTGKAYVFFGGTSMNNIADATMNEENVNSYFGISVSTAGDVNGDGLSDIVIGAYGYGSNTGRAYFYDYFMKNEIISDLTMTGESNSNYFGSSVSPAGDVNGDGFADVIVGAYGYGSITGRAYIYFGGNSMDNTADVVLNAEASGNAFGLSVSTAGDVNGDGYSDVIVGASFYNSGRGRAYIYFGGNTMNSIADVIMTGVGSNDEFAREVSNAGDLNGDGFSDVAVSAPFINKIYIYYGGAAMNNVDDVLLTGVSSFSIASAGDVNGDGFSDLIAGQTFSNGNAFIYYGGEIMDNSSDITLSGEASGSSFGISVSSAGDINGDGYTDVIVGSIGLNSYTGKAYIFLGSEQMDIIPDVIMTGEAVNNDFGKSVSTAGDINGDGFSDVIVGADGNNLNTGKAYIYFGGQVLNNSADVIMKGESVSKFGDAVASAGDLNGDGYSDLIVGANEYNSNTGRTYIYSGSAISVKPNILSIKDVSGDQGGYVNVKFARSAFDIPFSQTGGVNYQIERSSPPNISGYHWTSVATVLGIQNTVYTAEVHTPLDSGNSGNNTYYFRITAVSNSGNLWRSNILSGYSLDNISPSVVSPFNAFSESVNVRLTWKRNSAPDLLNYLLFRSVSPSIDPYTETPLTSSTDSTYLDTAPLNGLYYYFIVAQDIHNNYSPVAVAQSPVSSKNLFLFGAIQGLYDANTDIMIYDTVTVYLRNAVSPFAKIDSSKKELYGPGTGQEFTFSNAQNGIPYYVELKHRNALETWSADPVSFVNDAASIAYSADKIYAFGNNEILVDISPYNVYAFYSGDVNQDGYIDLTDVIQINNAANTFASGYVLTDLTGNNIVDLTDVLMAYNNATAFVSVIRP